MDGMLNNASITELKRFRNEVHVLANFYKPYTDHKIDIIPYKPQSNADQSALIHDVLTKLKNGEKLVIAVSSNNLLCKF